ncbi:MAG: hypothetical protein QJR03_11665 [Sphaerobacter sp.]|nr:hypothetical protein [Sphaerobacter sp.]
MLPLDLWTAQHLTRDVQAERRRRAGHARLATVACGDGPLVGWRRRLGSALIRAGRWLAGPTLPEQTGADRDLPHTV